MNLIFIRVLCLPGAAGKDAAEEHVKGTYFFYLDPSYSEEHTHD